MLMFLGCITGGEVWFGGICVCAGLVFVVGQVRLERLHMKRGCCDIVLVFDDFECGGWCAGLSACGLIVKVDGVWC